MSLAAYKVGYRENRMDINNFTSSQCSYYVNKIVEARGSSVLKSE